jgi:phage tail-like protein
VGQGVAAMGKPVIKYSEVEEGGLNMPTHKFYGRTRYPNLVLENVITGNEAALPWYKETVLEDRKIERKNGSIILNRWS